MRLSTLRMAVRVGLSPTSLRSRREPGMAAAATSQKAALEMSPGTVKSQALGDLAAGDRYGVALVHGAIDVEGGEHALGVVARLSGLDDGGFAIGEQSGKQDGAFHLGAGDRHLVGDGRELGGMDEQAARSRVFRRGVSMLAPIWPSGTVMRPIGREESEASPKSSEVKGCPASRPASRRMPVPELPQSMGAAGAVSLQRLAVDSQVDGAVAGEFVEHLMGGAEGLHGVERVEAVLAGQEIADGAGAVGQTAENGGAVGHALVSRNAEFRVELGNGGDSEFRHDEG